MAHDQLLKQNEPTALINYNNYNKYINYIIIKSNFILNPSQPQFHNLEYTSNLILDTWCSLGL